MTLTFGSVPEGLTSNLPLFLISSLANLIAFLHLVEFIIFLSFMIDLSSYFYRRLEHAEGVTNYLFFVFKNFLAFFLIDFSGNGGARFYGNCFFQRCGFG